MKNYAIPCALIGTLVMAGSASAAPNLVANGSFEGRPEFRHPAGALAEL
jgi:hypothetical protein